MMDRLSVHRLLILQRKPKLDHTKPSTGLHAARGPRVGHSWSKPMMLSLFQVDYQWSTKGRI